MMKYSNLFTTYGLAWSEGGLIFVYFRLGFLFCFQYKIDIVLQASEYAAAK